MANLSIKLLLQLYTEEKHHKFTQWLNVCEILVLCVLLKKVTWKPLNISLNPCAQIFFI